MAELKREKVRLLKAKRIVMGDYIVKKNYLVEKQMAEVANFYQRNFAQAVLNWEINRQEERLRPTTVQLKK